LHQEWNDFAVALGNRQLVNRTWCWNRTAGTSAM